MLLAASQERKEKTSPLFKDMDGAYISLDKISTVSSMIMEFDAFGRRFEIELRDSSRRTDGVLMKQSLCDFSIVTVNDAEAYGSISLCDSIHGTFVSSGLEYQLRSGGIDEIEVEKIRYEPGSVQLSRANLLERKPGTKVVKIFLINDLQRVQEVGPDINSDTAEIFDNAKKIFENNEWKRYGIELALNGILNIVDKPIINESFSEFLGLSKLRFGGPSALQDLEKSRSMDKLRIFSEMFESIKNEPGDTNNLLASSNLVVLLQASDTDKVNGLTFIGGAGAPSKGFGIVEISENDSYFYKGKILAHEISHSLGARHDLDSKHLMRKEESPADREEEMPLSRRSIEEIEDFIAENETDFEAVNTCGNGIMDRTKECDSGLLFGSVCCTKDCKLRPRAECDDANGKCCSGCRLVSEGTRCRKKSLSVYKGDCEKESYCNGRSPRCRIKYAKDGFRPKYGGTCKKGVLQTESLICQRIGKFFSPKCSSPDGNLWCLDEYNACTSIVTSFHGSIVLHKGVEHNQTGEILSTFNSRNFYAGLSPPSL